MGYTLSQFCSQTEMNFDYKGNDIAVASNPNITTPDICCQWCLLAPNCRAFTFYANTCWLKSSSAGRISSPGRNKNYD